MLQKIKERFLKKELELLNVLRDDLLEQSNRRLENLEIREKKVKEEEQQLKKLKSYINSEEHKKYMLEFKKQYQDEFDRLTRSISNMIDFDLFPTKKVWSIDWYTNEPKEIEIKELIIKEKSVSIIADEFYKEWHFFKTEKEAIEHYNNYLESRKIKND